MLGLKYCVVQYLDIQNIILFIEKRYKNISKNIWWFQKNGVLLSFGEVAEWSIAAVLKTVELRGSGGSNPSLSARSQRSKKMSKDIFLFFIPTCKLACERRYKEQKVLRSSFLLSVGLAGAPAASRRERR